MLNSFDHPEFGRIVLRDSPIRLHRTTKLPLVASPMLGEHNADVMTELLGLSPGEIEALRSAGVLGRTPIHIRENAAPLLLALRLQRRR